MVYVRRCLSESSLRVRYLGVPDPTNVTEVLVIYGQVKSFERSENVLHSTLANQAREVDDVAPNSRL